MGQGRFISRDPFDDETFFPNIVSVDGSTFTKGNNLYNLTSNNMVTQVDFLGLAYGNPVPSCVSCSSSTSGSLCPKKCCNGKMTQLVPIWNCTRALGGVINFGPLKHGYICCQGSNSGCLGVQKYRPSCMNSCLKRLHRWTLAEQYCHEQCYSQVGDQIEAEVDASGNCEMRCVTPDEKKVACNNPTMPWNYSVLSWHHCYSFANEVTATKCP
jgi:hypothetical protein